MTALYHLSPVVDRFRLEESVVGRWATPGLVAVQFAVGPAADQGVLAPRAVEVVYVVDAGGEPAKYDGRLVHPPGARRAIVVVLVVAAPRVPGVVAVPVLRVHAPRPVIVRR